MVSQNNGTFVPWLQQTHLVSATYIGALGSHYAFYSVATDANGNREAAPGTPDAETLVSLTNSPPVLTLPVLISIDEGEALDAAFTASDPDSDQTLTFSLSPGAPPGLLVNAALRRLTWTTGEGNGPSTNVVRLVARDNGFPSQSVTGHVTIIVREVNSAPILTAVPNQTVNEGILLSFAAQGTDSDLPVQPLTYSLGQKPAGATIAASTGIFSWRPSDIQGGTNYVIEIIVRDNGSPMLSATQSFVITVKDTRSDFAFSIGSTNLYVGESNAVPLTITSGIGLSELSFTFETDISRVTNFAIKTVAGIGSSIQFNGAQAFVRLTSLNAASLENGMVVGKFTFTAVSNEHSAVVPLRASQVQAQPTSGNPLVNPTVNHGRLFVVGREPILDAKGGGAGRPRVLDLYGHAGRRYLIESRTNLFGGGGWTPAVELDLVGAFESTILADASEQIFYRAVEEISAPISLRLSGSQAILSWPTNSEGCVLEQTSSLTPPVTWTRVPTPPGISGEFLLTLPRTNTQFFRLRCDTIVPVANGSFEADDWSSPPPGPGPIGDAGFHEYLSLYGRMLTGWSVFASGSSPAGVNESSGYGPARQGRQWIALGAYQTGGRGVEQTVSGFVPGQSYHLNFSISSQYYFGSSHVRVSFPSGSSTAAADFNAPPATGRFWDHWSDHSLQFVATNTSVTIRFTDLGGGPQALMVGLDNVSVTADQR